MKKTLKTICLLAFWGIFLLSCKEEHRNDDFNGQWKVKGEWPVGWEWSGVWWDKGEKTLFIRSTQYSYAEEAFLPYWIIAKRATGHTGFDSKKVPDSLFSGLPKSNVDTILATQDHFKLDSSFTNYMKATCQNTLILHAIKLGKETFFAVTSDSIGLPSQLVQGNLDKNACPYNPIYGWKESFMSSWLWMTEEEDLLLLFRFRPGGLEGRLLITGLEAS